MLYFPSSLPVWRRNKSFHSIEVCVVCSVFYVLCSDLWYFVCVCSAFSLVQSPLHVLSCLLFLAYVLYMASCLLHVRCFLCALLCLRVYVHVYIYIQYSDCLYECLSVRTHADNRKLRIRLSMHAKKLLTIVLKYPVAISSSSGFVNIPSNNFPSLSHFGAKLH